MQVAMKLTDKQFHAVLYALEFYKVFNTHYFIDAFNLLATTGYNKKEKNVLTINWKQNTALMEKDLFSEPIPENMKYEYSENKKIVERIHTMIIDKNNCLHKENNQNIFVMKMDLREIHYLANILEFYVRMVLGQWFYITYLGSPIYMSDDVTEEKIYYYRNKIF